MVEMASAAVTTVELETATTLVKLRVAIPEMVAIVEMQRRAVMIRRKRIRNMIGMTK